MTPAEVYHVLTDAQHDYVCMVRELNAAKRKMHPVDPWGLPIVKRMLRARRDLAMVAGIKSFPRDKMYEQNGTGHDQH